MLKGKLLAPLNKNTEKNLSKTILIDKIKNSYTIFNPFNPYELQSKEFLTNSNYHTEENIFTYYLDNGKIRKYLITINGEIVFKNILGVENVTPYEGDENNKVLCILYEIDNKRYINIFDKRQKKLLLPIKNELDVDKLNIKFTNQIFSIKNNILIITYNNITILFNISENKIITKLTDFGPTTPNIYSFIGEKYIFVVKNEEKIKKITIFNTAGEIIYQKEVYNLSYINFISGTPYFLVREHTGRYYYDYIYQIKDNKVSELISSKKLEEMYNTKVISSAVKNKKYFVVIFANKILVTNLFNNKKFVINDVENVKRYSVGIVDDVLIIPQDSTGYNKKLYSIEKEKFIGTTYTLTTNEFKYGFFPIYEKFIDNKTKKEKFKTTIKDKYGKTIIEFISNDRDFHILHWEKQDFKYLKIFGDKLYLLKVNKQTGNIEEMVSKIQKNYPRLGKYSVQIVKDYIIFYKKYKDNVEFYVFDFDGNLITLFKNITYGYGDIDQISIEFNIIDFKDKIYLIQFNNKTYIKFKDNLYSFNEGYNNYTVINNYLILYGYNTSILIDLTKLKTIYKSTHITPLGDKYVLINLKKKYILFDTVSGEYTNFSMDIPYLLKNKGILFKNKILKYQESRNKDYFTHLSTQNLENMVYNDEEMYFSHTIPTYYPIISDNTDTNSKTKNYFINYENIFAPYNKMITGENGDTIIDIKNGDKYKINNVNFIYLNKYGLIKANLVDWNKYITCSSGLIIGYKTIKYKKYETKNIAKLAILNNICLYNEKRNIFLNHISTLKKINNISDLREGEEIKLIDVKNNNPEYLKIYGITKPIYLVVYPDNTINFIDDNLNKVLSKNLENINYKNIIDYGIINNKLFFKYLASEKNIKRIHTIILSLNNMKGKH